MATWAVLRRHGRLIINLGGGDNQHALLAVARHHDFAVFAAFKDRIEAG